jgi:iron complex outermembrane receptor protein
MYDRSTWNYDTDYDPAIQPLTQFDRGNRRSKAVYAILNATMMDERVYTVAGARYTKSSGSNDNFFSPAASIAKANHSKLAPQFGAGWKLLPDVLLYASYSSSFQNSIANLQVANVPSGPANPSVSTGYEVGLKTDFLGGRISSTMSLYSIEQEDRVINFNTTSSTGLILVNRMQGTLDRSRGIELEVNWSPTKRFQIFASGSLNDVRVIKVPAGADYLLGSHPENTVKALANLWARYSFYSGAAKGLWFGAGANYSGKKAQRVNNPALFTDSYLLLNSAMGYDWKWRSRPVSATLNWDNMTDESYVPAAFLRGRPIMVTLELKVTY